MKFFIGNLNLAELLLALSCYFFAIYCYYYRLLGKHIQNLKFHIAEIKQRYSYGLILIFYWKKQLLEFPRISTSNPMLKVVAEAPDEYVNCVESQQYSHNLFHQVEVK